MSRPRHTWGAAQYDTHGRQYYECRKIGCNIRRVTIQAMHLKWHCEYHHPSGHVTIGRAPACFGATPIPENPNIINNGLTGTKNR